MPVYAAIKLRADALNRAPAVVYRKSPDGTRTPVGGSASFLKVQEDSTGIGLATIALAGTATSIAALIFAWYLRKRRLDTPDNR